MKKKKKQNKFLKEMKPAFSLASVSISSSILGGALQSKLPAGITNPLTTTGRVTGTFISPVATLGALSIVKKQMKKISKKAKRRYKNYG